MLVWEQENLDSCLQHLIIGNKNQLHVLVVFSEIIWNIICGYLATSNFEQEAMADIYFFCSEL